MATHSYADWNQYFLNLFFYQSTPGSLIRFNVSKEWLDSVPARDGMGGYLDFLEAIREACQRRPLYDWLCDMLGQQRRNPTSEPQYVAYLVFLCLPWTWPFEEKQTARNYWDRLKTMAKTYDIQCGRLVESNYHFRTLLNEDDDLLALLRTWTNNSSKVKGEFIYCHLYADSDDKVSLLRSQVWPTDDDLAWMPELLFCHTDQSKELDEEKLGQFCRQENQIQYAWTSFRNVFLSEEPLAKKVQKDALGQIYESYEDWVNHGRPVEKIQGETLRRVRDSDGGEKRAVNLLPHIWLRLKRNGTCWEKSLFLNTSGFPAEREEIVPICHIEINGRSHECALTRLQSGHYLIKNQDEVWNALAGVAFQDDLPSKHIRCGDFMFSPRKCYVMFQSAPGRFVQQDFATQGRDFYALYAVAHRKLFLRWCEDNNVKVDPHVGIGEGWFLQHVHGLDEEQCKLFPNGLDNEGQSGLFTRLQGGIQARMGASFRRRYLRDFLPNIEAYLPSTYSVQIQDEYGNRFDSATVLREIHGDEDDDAETDEMSVYATARDRYRMRTFSISLPSDFAGSELSFQFRVEGQNYGRIQRVKMAPAEASNIQIRGTHGWDHFGEVVKSSESESYWPDTEAIDASSMETMLPQVQPPVQSPDGSRYDAYWKFIDQLRQTQGDNGMPGKEFWAIVCANFRFVAAWRQQVQWLSDLGVLDIKTNEFGMWSRFYLNSPSLCLLPTKNGQGEWQAILSGAFTPAHLEKLGHFFNVETTEQWHETGKTLPLLPPRVVVTMTPGIGIEMLKEIAAESGLDWGGIPAFGFTRLSVTLEEWLDSKKRYIRDGNPSDDAVTSWYDMLGYRMLCRNADGKLANPLGTCPELFNTCLCTRPCPNIPQFAVSDLVNKGENHSVYIKDIPWGRWVSYLLEGRFSNLRFKIAYHPQTGTILFPEELPPPRVLARALTLCAGRIARKATSPWPYDQCAAYGLSIKAYDGSCLCFDGVPRDIAKGVAEKLHCELKDC